MPACKKTNERSKKEKGKINMQVQLLIWYVSNK
jgi:hypothetical protein